MYHIRGINFSANTTKTLYVAEALGLDYQYTEMNLAGGEHKTPEHLERHPLGKLPTLEHDGKSLFESNTICTYLANVTQSPLYPSAPYPRAVVDQWLNFFTNHLGRWLAAYAFEKYMRGMIGLGEPKVAVLQEAEGFIVEQLPVVEAQLAKTSHLAGGAPSVADYVAYAYFELGLKAEISLADYPKTAAWFEKLKVSDVVARAHTRLER